MSRVTIFPLNRSAAHPTIMSPATTKRKFLDALKMKTGRLLNVCGVPGLVQGIIINDELTGRTISVTPHPLYTIINIDGRDYYFHRIT
jgi:hypothetical protein